MFGVKKLAGHFDAGIYKSVKNQTLKAVSSAPVGMRAAASTRLAHANAAAAKAVTNSGSVNKARKIIYGGMAGASAMSATAMRPNADQSRTSYRGPMQTGRGIGRFS